MRAPNRGLRHRLEPPLGVMAAVPWPALVGPTYGLGGARIFTSDATLGQCRERALSPRGTPAKPALLLESPWPDRRVRLARHLIKAI